MLEGHNQKVCFQQSMYNQHLMDIESVHRNSGASAAVICTSARLIGDAETG